MSTYNDASLIYYPSGYKASKAYSLKPTDGSGDLAFTRASTATRVNEQGLIEGVRTNLMTYSEQFDNAAWDKTEDVTVNANATTAPNGALTAENVIPNATLNFHRIKQANTVSLSTSYTFSVYVKPNGYNFFLIRTSDTSNNNVGYDLINGTLTFTASGYTGFISEVGNGWYRLGYVRTYDATTVQIGFRPQPTGQTDNAISQFTGNGTSGVYVWGAQLEQSASATEYISTTTAAVSVGMLANVPRIDYTGGGCAKLLLEPQRTNYITYSNYNASIWTQTTASISINSATSPDGTTNAHTATRTSGSNQRIGVAAFSATVGQPYTNSIYLRKVSGSGLVRLIDINNAPTTFTLTTEWVRYSVTAIAVASTQRLYVEMTEDGDVIEFWQGQIENGSYSTSLIPTTTTAVTRVADAFTRNNIYTNGLITASGGTWFVDLKNNDQLAADNAPNGFWLGTSASTSNSNGTFYFRQGGGSQRSNIWKYTSGAATQLYTPTVSNSKIAIKWDGVTADIFVNGVKVVAATGFTETELQFFASTGVGRPFNIQSTMLFATPLSDSDLIALTTL